MGKKTMRPAAFNQGSLGRSMGGAPQMPQRQQAMSNALMGGGMPGMDMYSRKPTGGAMMGGMVGNAPPQAQPWNTAFGPPPQQQQGNTMSNSMQGGLMGMPPLPGAQPGMPGVAAAQASMQPQAAAPMQQAAMPGGQARRGNYLA